MITEDEKLEIAAMVLQLKEWSGKCPVECPLARLIINIIKLYDCCDKKPE